MKARDKEAKRLLALADRDFRAFAALEATATVDWTSACFHAQQAVEKWLKAVLALHGQEIPKTHDLVRLTNALIRIGVPVPVDVLTLGKLNPYAVMFRYDTDAAPETIDREEAKSVVNAIRRWAEQVVPHSE